MYETLIKEIMIHYNSDRCVHTDKTNLQNDKHTKTHTLKTQKTEKTQLTEQKSRWKYSRVLPSLVMDLVLPGSSISGPGIEDLGFIEHLMMEAEDTLVLGERSRCLCWSHWPQRPVIRIVFCGLLDPSPWAMLEREESRGEMKVAEECEVGLEVTGKE